MNKCTSKWMNGLINEREQLNEGVIDLMSE